MIRINIICIGKIKEKYFTDAISEYAKRLTAFCKFAVVELAEEKIRNNNPNGAEISEVIEAEGERILKKSVQVIMQWQCASRANSFQAKNFLQCSTMRQLQEKVRWILLSAEVTDLAIR